MEKMDTERQRQQANLHQKLLERKKRKQDAQKRKQEREMAKELLEQQKELAEVRSEHVSSTFIARDIYERTRDTFDYSRTSTNGQFSTTATIFRPGRRSRHLLSKRSRKRQRPVKCVPNP